MRVMRALHRHTIVMARASWSAVEFAVRGEDLVGFSSEVGVGPNSSSALFRSEKCGSARRFARARG